MQIPFDEIREGLLFCLLGSDRPIHESLAPALINQQEAMQNQFAGMTDIPFSYEEFEATRKDLISKVNAALSDTDKRFLISFEKAEPDWTAFDYPFFQNYSSVQWKLQNLSKLKSSNPAKLLVEAEKLKAVLYAEH